MVTSLLILRLLVVGAENMAPTHGHTSTLALASPSRSGCIVHIRTLQTSTRSEHDADLRRSTSHRSAYSIDRRCFVEPRLQRTLSANATRKPLESASANGSTVSAHSRQISPASSPLPCGSNSKRPKCSITGMMSLGRAGRF